MSSALMSHTFEPFVAAPMAELKISHLEVIPNKAISIPKMVKNYLKTAVTASFESLLSCCFCLSASSLAFSSSSRFLRSLFRARYSAIDSFFDVFSSGFRGVPKLWCYKSSKIVKSLPLALLSVGEVVELVAGGGVPSKAGCQIGWLLSDFCDEPKIEIFISKIDAILTVRIVVFWRFGYR